MKHFILTALLTISFATWASTSFAAQCISPSRIKQNAALLESTEGRGLGTGVLYQDDILITTYSNTQKAKNLQAYIPAYDNVSHNLKVLYAHPRPDIAIMKLAEPVSDTIPLTLARKVLRAEPMRFLSFPFNNRKRLGTAGTRLNTLARFTDDTRLLYFSATLDDWAFYGDNGGIFFNCKGELVGLNFGMINEGKKPELIYGLNMRAIEDALNAAGVPVRREY